MGVCLFPGNGETDGPDACFSYGEFSAFRRRLAAEEGFPLGDMRGFGGDTSWGEVATVLAPLLNHPDDHGRNISSQECRLILPRLEGVLSDWLSGSDSSPAARNQVRELSDLVSVLRVCVREDVELCFL